MKVEVWSDFVCPFCFIGKRRLEKALVQFPNQDEVEIEFKSFELDPNAPVYTEKSIYDSLAEKYGMSVDQAKQNSAQIAKQAEQEGLAFRFDAMKPTNTFDAHRLAKYAKTQGKELELTEKLLYAYFTESKNVGDHETLAALAEEVGIDREEAESVLKNKDDYANEVRKDFQLARQYGITGVPFFAINDKYAISGAQPVETFVRALEKAWEEAAAKPKFETIEGSKGSVCADGNCEV